MFYLFLTFKDLHESLGAGVTNILAGVIVALVVVIGIAIIYTRLQRRGYQKTIMNINEQTHSRPDDSMLCDVTERHTPIRIQWGGMAQ